ncbi:GNAT family N-acetyltransferase [Brachybacterium fresconis]|uniref:RimJ/RimL family protein N-acetyltransferase n=1 Tax=Brachybacterium fresconis TaxID=173363 RepID=A0ABS4YPF8_9MICO|nr:RimJ/RimL family protein N-acetyltransferase [Brachybacterium fresconis]
MHGAAIPSFDGDRRAVRPSAVSPVRTPRLHLAPVCSNDLEELFALHADPCAFAEDLTEPLTEVAQMRWVLGRWLESWERHGTGYLTVRPRAEDGSAHGSTDDGASRAGARRDGPLLGVVGITPLEDERALSAYWRLDPAATGHGLATEAMSAVLAHPALGARHHEVLAVTAAANRPSRALAARLGFSPAPSGRPVPGDRSDDILLIRPPDAPLSRRSTI